MKKLFTVFMLLVSFALLTACNKGEQEIVVAREDQFIVGLECNYAPFNWTEDSKTPYNYSIANYEGKYADGYDVQIAKAIAASLGKVLVIQKLEWDSLIPELESKRIDAIIAGMSPTEERKQSVNFTNEYYRSSHVVLVMSDGAYKDAKTINDFNGAKIVGQQGTIYNDLIPQLIGATHMTPLESVPDILTAMLGNRADGTVLELPVARGIVAQNSEFSYVTLNPGFSVSEEDVIVSVATRIGEDELLDNINLILAGIKETTRVSLMEQAVGRAS